MEKLKHVHDTVQSQTFLYQVELEKRHKVALDCQITRLNTHLQTKTDWILTETRASCDLSLSRCPAELGTSQIVPSLCDVSAGCWAEFICVIQTIETPCIIHGLLEKHMAVLTWWQFCLIWAQGYNTTWSQPFKKTDSDVISNLFSIEHNRASFWMLVLNSIFWEM